VDIGIFEYMARYDYETVLLCQDNATGLKAVIVVHDTTLGPAAGGTRMWVYDNELDAIEDCLRLARGMTYKYAAAGVNLGGGKAVVIGDPRREKSEALFRALGRFINRLNGTYLTGEDVGTTLLEMEYMRYETPYVITLPTYMGGAGPIGGATALGVVQGMRASAKHAFGADDLRGRSVAVQGLGAVGAEVIPLLAEAGARIVVADIDPAKVEAVRAQYAVDVADPTQIHALEVDIYCPCALGAVVNDRTLDEFRCKIICGSANNQLQAERHGEALGARGILYAPDYIVNAGGTVFDTDRLGPGGFNRERGLEKVRRIYGTAEQVFQIAEREGIPTYAAADRLAERRIAAIRQAKALATHGELLRG
jgi:leucine dehydrogenase